MGPVALCMVFMAMLGALFGGGSLATGEKPRRRWPLTKNEAAMYHRLVQSLPDHVVFAQVSFGALLTARSRATRNRFDRKVADFVVCDKALQVLAIIELDDKSHRGREFKDAARDKLLQDAGYRVIRYPRIPNIEKVRADFGVLPTATKASGDQVVSTEDSDQQVLEPQMERLTARAS